MRRPGTDPGYNRPRPHPEGDKPQHRDVAFPAPGPERQPAERAPDQATELMNAAEAYRSVDLGATLENTARYWQEKLHQVPGETDQDRIATEYHIAESDAEATFGRGLLTGLQEKPDTSPLDPNVGRELDPFERVPRQLAEQRTGFGTFGQLEETFDRLTQIEPEKHAELTQTFNDLSVDARYALKAYEQTQVSRLNVLGSAPDVRRAADEAIDGNGSLMDDSESGGRSTRVARPPKPEEKVQREFSDAHIIRKEAPKDVYRTEWTPLPAIHPDGRDLMRVVEMQNQQETTRQELKNAEKRSVTERHTEIEKAAGLTPEKQDDGSIILLRNSEVVNPTDRSVVDKEGYEHLSDAEVDDLTVSDDDDLLPLDELVAHTRSESEDTQLDVSPWEKSKKPKTDQPDRNRDTKVD